MRKENNGDLAHWCPRSDQVTEKDQVTKRGHVTRKKKGNHTKPRI